MLEVYDTHAHLDEINELEQSLTKARSVGVIGIVAVGSDSNSNQRVLDIAGQYPGFVYPAIGLHPWSIKPDTTESDLELVEKHAGDVIAIG